MTADTIEVIRGKVRQICEKSGRLTSEVTLLAVSKTFGPERIREAVDAGVPDIGENYVQELLRKKDSLGDSRIRWHHIGHLQLNKVRFIADWIHLIHAVDSRRLAVEINKRAARAARTIDVLVEVNSTGEEAKFGLPPEDVGQFVRSLEDLESIRVSGLMTIGFFLPDPEPSRPLYRRMRELRDEIRKVGQTNAPMNELSMGMTGDYTVAIEEGATIIRLGTAIFGKRKARYGQQPTKEIS